MAPENRRSFVKKSMGASISVSSATFFSSLIRARGEEGGGSTTTENTTTEGWETTYAPTEPPTGGPTTEDWDTTVATVETTTENATTENWDTTAATTEETTIETTSQVPLVKHKFSGGSDSYPDIPTDPLGGSQQSANYQLDGNKTDSNGNTTYYRAYLSIAFDPMGSDEDVPDTVKSEKFKIACTVKKYDSASNSWVAIDSSQDSGVLKPHVVSGSVNIDDKGELEGSPGTDNPPNESNVYGKTTAAVTWIKNGNGGPTLKCAVTVECSTFGISETHNGFAVFEKVMGTPPPH